MVDVKKTTDFRISMDDGSPESEYKATLTDLQMERISHRVTLLSILVPIIIVILLAGAYFNFKRIQALSSRDVTKLANDLSSKFSSLSLKYAKLEELLNKEVSPMNEMLLAFENLTQSLNQRVAKAEKNLAHLDRLTKQQDALETSIKTLSESTLTTKSATGALSSTLAVLEEEVKTLNKTFESLDNELAADLEKIVAQIAGLKRKVDEAQSDISLLATDKISQKTLTATLKANRLKDGKDSSRARKEINRKLVAMGRKVDALQNFMDKQIQFQKMVSRKLLSKSKTAPNWSPKPGAGPIIEERLD